MCPFTEMLNFSHGGVSRLQINCSENTAVSQTPFDWNLTSSTVPPGPNTETIQSSWQLTPLIHSYRFSSLPVFILVAVFMGLLVLCTLCGNLMVGIALYRYKNLRTMSNLLIGNLALSDFLLAMTVMPISTAHDLLGYWIFGKAMCTIWLCIDVLYCTASIWGLCTIAVDRYTATVYPMWYHEQRSPKRALVYVIFVWLFSLIVSFAPFIGWREMIPQFYQYDEGTGTHECVLFILQSYVMYSAFGSFVIPFWLMLFLYIRIFIALHRRSIELQKKASLHVPRFGNRVEESSKFVNNSFFKRRNKESFEMQTVITKDSLTATTSSEQNDDYPNNYRSDHECFKSDDGEECKSLSPGDASDKDLLPKKSNNSVMAANNSHAAGPVANCNHQTKVILNPSYHMITDSEHDSEFEEKRHYKGRGTQYKRLSLQPHPISVKTKFIKSVSINLEDLTIEDYNSVYDDDPEESKRTTCLRRPSKHFLSLPWSKSGKKLRRNHLTASMKRRFELREQRATKRMALIMVCFIVCWMPFFLMYIARSLCNHCYVNYHLQAALTWLGYVNSALNPILYTIFNDDFRRAFQRMLGLSRAQQTQKRT